MKHKSVIIGEGFADDIICSQVQNDIDDYI